MKPALGLIVGLVFGLGLALSGLLDPARVHGFLDVAGHWDPSLAFALGGAVSVAFLGYRLSRRITRPAFADRFDLPSETRIDRRFVAGAALFGIGWGLGGICPGPAITALSVGYSGSFLSPAACSSAWRSIASFRPNSARRPPEGRAPWTCSTPC
jgi:hypothetical protein